MTIASYNLRALICLYPISGLQQHESYVNIKNNKLINKQTNKQTNKETKKQRNEETKKQTNKEMNTKHIYIYIHTYAHNIELNC